MPTSVAAIKQDAMTAVAITAAYIAVSDSINSVTFGPEVYNPHAHAKAPCFYALLYPDDYIEGFFSG